MDEGGHSLPHEILGELWRMAGEPSFREIASSDEGLSKTTAENLLKGTVTTPRLESVQAFIRACLRHDGKRRPGGLSGREREVGHWVRRYAAVRDSVRSGLGRAAKSRVRLGLIPVLADCFRPRAILDDCLGSTWLLTGMGGVGKTQIAAALAQQASDGVGHELVAWIDVGARISVVNAYAAIAAEVVRREFADPEEAALAALAWLRDTPSRWLIVLDDLISPEHLTGLWPPTSETGQVVVTTRYQGAALHRRDRILVEVGVFAPEESAAYLGDKLEGHRHLIDDDANLTALAEDLGHLPLALAQAASYQIDRDLLLSEYRTRLADRRRQLEHLFPGHTELPDDHQRVVSATWSLSIDLANSLAPAGVARLLLELASLLRPNGIPVALFTSEAVLNFLHELDVDADAVRDGLRVLHRLNLIAMDSAQVRVHALVQRSTRDTLDGSLTSALDDLAYVAADALVLIWPEVDSVSSGSAVRANAEELIANSGAHLYHPSVHQLLYQVGRSLGRAGLAAQAVAYFQELHQATVSHLEADCPDALFVRCELAHCGGLAGDPPGAAQALADVIADLDRVLGKQDIRAMQMRSNWAYWRGMSGDPDGAADVLDDVLDDLVPLAGLHHPDVLTIRQNLATWRGEAGEPSTAVEILKEVLVDLVEVFGADSRHVLLAGRSLGNWLALAGDHAGASQVLDGVLADSVRVLGPDHPETLGTRSISSRVLGRSGDPTGAARLLEDLIADQERVLGGDHPETLDSRDDLARWLGEKGDPAAAVDVLSDLLEDRTRLFGADHPSVMATSQVLEYWRGRV